MNSRIQFFVGLALLVLISAAPARANHVEKGSSGYGDTDPNCAISTINCQSTTQLTNTVDGNPVFSFTFVNGFETPPETLYAFQISDLITPGSILSLTFPNIVGLGYGGFYCNNNITSDPTVAVDAGGVTMKDSGTGNNLPCTAAFLPSNPDQFFTESDTGNIAKFTFTNDPNLPKSFTFFVDNLHDLPTAVGFTPGGTTSLPEPTSIFLLGTGLLALCGGALRRKKNILAA